MINRKLTSYKLIKLFWKHPKNYPSITILKKHLRTKKFVIKKKEFLFKQE